jgi:hypothetical protein
MGDDEPEQCLRHHGSYREQAALENYQLESVTLQQVCEIAQANERGHRYVLHTEEQRIDSGVNDEPGNQRQATHKRHARLAPCE